MKTHDEIRETIDAVARDHICDPATEEIIGILHALNERMCSKHIETLAIMLSLSNRLHELESRLEEIHPTIK